MMSQLWVRHTLLLLLVSAFSVGITFAGMGLFGWAYAELISDSIPPNVESRLSELEMITQTALEEIDAIYAEWFTPVINYQRLILLFTIGLLCLALSAAMATITASWISRPIMIIAGLVKALVAGRLDSRTHQSDRKNVYGPEILALMSDVNGLAATLEEREARVRKDTAIIAHELRTPLTTITSQLFAIQDGIIEPSPDEIGLLLAGAKQLGRIIDDLRVLSLADAGKLSLRFETLALDKLIMECAQQHSRELNRAGLTLVQSATPVELEGDKDRLVQVVRALLFNAMAHAKGGTRVEVSCNPHPNGAVIIVSDNGSGLPENADQKDLFEPFSRPGHEQSGTGLGLAVASGIILAHRGEIQARSSKSGGALFQIILPAKQSNSDG